MLKKLLPILILPMLLGGCATTMTNLTPTTQERTTNNVYAVEVSLLTRQQTLRWESIKPQIIVGSQSIPMRPTPLMTNRWEGQIPVPPDAKSVTYRYKFDYKYNAMGGPRTDSLLSPNYKLNIVDP